MFQLAGVGYEYVEEEPLLKGLTLSVIPDESYVLVGPSGGGKSTILKLMAGLLVPTAGTISFEGKDINQMNRAEKLHFLRGLSMTFQNSGLFDSMTARENLLLPLTEATDLNKKEIEERIEAGLKEVGLDHAAHLYPHEISGGMRKRLSIARALVLRPDVILYDEPTAGLDPITSRSIAELILQMKYKYEMTTVVVTSDLGLAHQLADRIGFLHEGKIRMAADFATMQGSSDPVVRQFMTGSDVGPLTEGA